MDDFENVLLCDVEPSRDVRDFHELISGQRAIDQNADRVAGLLRQAHRVSTRAAAAAETVGRMLVSQFALAWQGPRGHPTKFT